MCPAHFHLANKGSSKCQFGISKLMPMPRDYLATCSVPKKACL